MFNRGLAVLPDKMIRVLPHYLARSAASGPDRIAVVAGNTSLSYAELHARSDRLAALLASHGIRRGDRVGILTPKSTGAIVAIQGILKAGAVYVPIDPASPAVRAAYIVENCGMRCLLTTGRLSPVLREIAAKVPALERIVLLDEAGMEAEIPVPVSPWRDVLAHAGEAPALTSIETDLAYILYTSGSTGAPKGVMISHLNARTFVDWAQETIGVRAGERLSSHAPLHFDLSIFDIFVAFSAGATLVVVPDGLSSFPFRLAEWIDQQRIAVWYSVPTILSMLVRGGELSRFRYEHLRAVIFAGEVFPVKYLRDLMTAVPNATYWNFYGPTETNVITYYRVPILPPERVTPIPIGIPCENIEVFAIGDDGRRIEGPAEVGELYARGSCVASGYWGDPDKTARSFVPSPIQSDFREMVYRTGDIVTLDEAGNYLFLGRRDDMVKSRGYRIELGEVEAALYRHDRIREAAVVALPDPAIGNRLVAFVVIEAGPKLEPADLQDFCAGSVPRYMVPESVEFLDRLPKTSTGKVDKVALARAADAAPSS